MGTPLCTDVEICISWSVLLVTFHPYYITAEESCVCVALRFSITQGLPRCWPDHLKLLSVWWSVCYSELASFLLYMCNALTHPRTAVMVPRNMYRCVHRNVCVCGALLVKHRF